jgi:hypothetical protein
MAQERAQETERERAERNRRIAQENLRLAEEERQRKRYLTKLLTENTPSEDFFKQFGTSSR